jgi:hypothetical protein
MNVEAKARQLVIASAVDLNAAAKRYRWPMICDPFCRFTYSKHDELLALWRSLPSESGIPYRRDMTARLLKPYLNSVAIYERVETPGGEVRYRVRLMGSKIVQVFGELTGKFLDEAVPEDFVARWHALPDVTLGTGGPVRLLIRSDTFNKAHMVAEYLCVPLRADDGAAKLVLYAGHYEGQRRWTEVEAEERERLGLEPLGIL